MSFDVDGDGTPDNDISLSLSSYKFAGDKASIGGILGFTQHDVWLLGVESGTNLTSIIDVSMVDRSTLAVIVSKSRHKALTRITAKTPISFSSSYNFQGGICEDYYPERYKFD